MRCPFCGHADNKVIDSRLGRDGEEIRRRRECLECERRFTTRERVEEVPVAALREGDLVLVRPGDSIAADGVVRSGKSDVNESMITGESVPVAKSEGAKVIAGAVNGSGSLRV